MKFFIKVMTLASVVFFISSTHACKKHPKGNTVSLLAEADLTESNPKKQQFVKIALLLDTSNSMDGLINQAKAQLWDIVNEFTYAKCSNHGRPELKIALYEYGNDDLSSREGYIRQVLNFSSDLDEISEKLFSLTTNGGEEYCGEVIHTSLQQLEWGNNPDDLKLIFIAGNEPFTQGKLNYKDATAQAMEKDVVVNTIFCGNYEQGINTHWKNGAVLTGGDYMAIDHNQEVIYIKTPFDAVILELNRKLNDTYIAYGNLGTSKLVAQEIQDSNALQLEEAVAVKRAVSKSSRLYKNSSWDLVDAVEDSEMSIDELDRNKLPEELREKSKSDIKKYIDSKKEERIHIQKEINTLNAKRKAYIAKAQNQQKGELENAMMAAIKKQAAQKNYIWE